MQVDVRQQRRSHRSLRSSYPRFRPLALLRHARLQPFLDQANHAGVTHPVLDKLHSPFVALVVKESTDVRTQHPAHSLPMESHTERVQRLMRAAPRPETIRKAFEVHLINFIEDGHHGLLNNLVLQRRDTQRTLPPVSLRYIDSPRSSRPVRSTMYPVVQIGEPTFQSGFIPFPRDTVHPGCSLPLQRVTALPQQS